MLNGRSYEEFDPGGSVRTQRSLGDYADLNTGLVNVFKPTVRSLESTIFQCISLFGWMLISVGYSLLGLSNNFVVRQMLSRIDWLIQAWRNRASDSSVAGSVRTQGLLSRVELEEPGGRTRR